MTISRTTWLSLVFTAVACVSSTLPSTSLAYNPVAPGATPTPGPGWAVPHNLTPSTVITPDMVWGKEYSHDRDRPVAGKVTLWDGTGRTAAGRNYRPNPWLPEGTPRDIEGDIDALANSRDILFHELLDDQTAMVLLARQRDRQLGRLLRQPAEAAVLCPCGQAFRSLHSGRSAAPGS